MYYGSDERVVINFFGGLLRFYTLVVIGLRGAFVLFFSTNRLYNDTVICGLISITLFGFILRVE